MPTGNQLVYTPAPNFHGTDRFTYRAIDTRGASVIGTAHVTVIPVNHAPVAVDATAATVQDRAVTIDVLAHDTDVDGDHLQVSSLTPSGHGTVVLHGDGTFTYTPEANFSGRDGFVYTVSDGQGGTAWGRVTVIVIPVNDAVATSVGTAVDIAMLADDASIDRDALTVVSVTPGANGTVTLIAPGTVRYTPNPGFRGQDQFTYTVSDAQGGTAMSTVTVTVAYAPVAVAQSVMTTEDTPVQITLTGSDVDGDPLTFSIVTGPAHGSLSDTPPAVTYTPNSDFNGTDSFTFRVSDDTLSSPPATVSLTVTATRLSNGGFESGDFTAWSTIGETRIETGAFGSGPTEGIFQAFLSTAGRVEEPGDPGGNAVPVADLEAFLALPAGGLEAISTHTVIEGSAIRRTFTAQAGAVVSFDWNFLTNETTNLHAPQPLNPDTNDLAFVTMVPSLPVTGLADTFWTFSLTPTVLFRATGGETGFRTLSLTIPSTGTYTLGIGVVDIGDEKGLSGLLLDNVTLIPPGP